jgi:NAD+ diphosphatase
VTGSLSDSNWFVGNQLMHNNGRVEPATAHSFRQLLFAHLLESRMLSSPRNFSLVNETQFLAGTHAHPLILHFRGAELLVDDTGRAFAATDHGSLATFDAAGCDTLVVGQLGEQRVVTRAVAQDTPAPEGTRWTGLRSLFGLMPDESVALAGRAAQLVEWDRSHRYCGVCAAATVRQAHERARRCAACGLSAYPRISPAMMCLVTRGREILLARNVNFPPGRYSALAGFVEAGESIEETIAREVREEVAIDVANPTYFASQSWPFPHSLMIAFTAEYAGGELTPNGHEIAEAGWFSVDNLPQLPPKVSIARALIEDTLKRLATGHSTA